MQPINQLAHVGYIYDCFIAQHTDKMMQSSESYLGEQFLRSEEQKH